MNVLAHISDHKLVGTCILLQLKTQIFSFKTFLDQDKASLVRGCMAKKDKGQRRFTDTIGMQGQKITMDVNLQLGFKM